MGDQLGIQRGRAWHTERGKNAYRNKAESWETGYKKKGRRKHKRVKVRAHKRRRK